MIESPSSYGLASANVVQWLIRAFYEEQWAAHSDAKRLKLAFVIKLGALRGKAVGIVSNKLGTCRGYSPLFSPNAAGSSVFIYSQSSAEAFRSAVLSPFFAAQRAPGWDAALFQSGITALFGKQLDATLGALKPVYNASIFNIDVTTSGAPPVDAAPDANDSGACGALPAAAVAGISVAATVALLALVGVFAYKVFGLSMVRRSALLPSMERSRNANSEMLAAPEPFSDAENGLSASLIAPQRRWRTAMA